MSLSSTGKRKRAMTPAAVGASTSGGSRGRDHSSRRMSASAKIALLVAGVVIVLGALFVANHASSSANQYPFQVGSPRQGQQAPPINLASTGGGHFRLSAERGQTVLLFFQEGVDCEPCWTQIKDIESNWHQFQALGIDKMITITGNPLSALQQKVADEGISFPVLADPGLTVSQAYDANQYGMMGPSADGHTFIVVGPTGTIKWRADYGGAPKYVMDLPVSNLVSDMRKGLTSGR
jgi:peroxiredoxin